jgi:hypothetical protein
LQRLGAGSHLKFPLAFKLFGFSKHG